MNITNEQIEMLGAIIAAPVQALTPEQQGVRIKFKASVIKAELATLIQSGRTGINHDAVIAHIEDVVRDIRCDAEQSYPTAAIQRTLARLKEIDGVIVSFRAFLALQRV